MTDQEKKQRIEERRTELRELQATPRSDWHTAFEAFLHFTTYRCKGVTIRTEVEIGADAPRTDYVILTEDEAQEFEEPFFRIFKKINLLEFKNPHDALNRRVIHKILGYAHLLIGTAEREGDVPEDQVTLSIFRAVKNPELFQEMEKAGELVRTETPGIYHVAGLTKLPFQIVITSELEGAEYAACRALTDKADGVDIRRVIEALEREPEDRIREYYGMYLSLIAEKNPEAFAEIRSDGDMEYKYPGLMKVFEKDVNAKISAGVQETLVTSILNLMDTTKWPIERAMDSLKIPQSQRAVYAGLVEKRT